MILEDIEGLGVDAAMEYYKTTHYMQNRKTDYIFDLQ